MTFHQTQAPIEDDLLALAEDLLRQIKRKKWDSVFSNLEDLCELMNSEDFPQEPL